MPQLRLRLRSIPAACVALVLGAGSGVAQAQLSLMTEPQGARVSAPAPNIIISVDDSGSMGWPQNGVTGIETLRAALKQTFNDKALLPDHKVRIAWQSMNMCPGFSGFSGGCGNNSMRTLDSTHRANFLSWVDRLYASGGTPSFNMFLKAGQYLQMSGLNSPWASVPGQDGTELSCRKSFHVFLSDGGYGDSTSAVGNADGSSRIGQTQGDRRYVPNTSQTRLYTDSHANRLADVAFHYWATDLRPDLPDDVPPYWADHNGQKGYYETRNQDFGTDGGGAAVLEPYWNPRNNPATWQHMVNYTIGFMSAATWGGDPVWRGESNAGLGPLIRGNALWQNHPYPDHWHAAINSRGRFIPVENPNQLSTAFREIFKEITDRGTGAPAAAAGSNLRVGAPGLAFVSSFEASDWSGSVAAYPIAANGSQSATAAWDAAKLLDARAATDPRRIVTQNSANGKGVLFSWNNLSTTQQAQLNGGDALGPQRVQFVEGVLSAHSSFRSRTSRMGSVINSVPLFVGAPGSGLSRSAAYSTFVQSHRQRPAMTYVGSSAGMLHGFDAATGRERLAYVPQGVYTKLGALTDTNYQHQYMVDGSPMAADADLRSQPGSGAANWRTVLVGTLGLGGRGYFALDVTEPGTFGSAEPNSLLLLDRSAPGTTGADADIGHIASPPVVDSQGDSRSEQIVRLNDQRWAVLLGNGVNSPNQRPVLLIQYLDGDKALKTLVASTATGQGNGLGTPRAVDLDGNGTTDLVYAGDQKGQLWRFDMLNADASTWQVGLNGQPLVTGVGGQPITAAPYWLPHPKGGLQVAFGAGRQLANGDSANSTAQTLFGVRDNFTVGVSNGVRRLSGSTQVAGLGQLVSQSIASSREGFSRTSRNLVNYSTHAGWYLPLPVAGERLIENPSHLMGNVIEFVTFTPSALPAASCKPSFGSGTTYINFFDVIQGAPPTKSLLSNITTDARYLANRYQGSGLRVQSRSLLGRTDLAIDPERGSSSKVSYDFPLTPAQVDWRQLR